MYFGGFLECFDDEIIGRLLIKMHRDRKLSGLNVDARWRSFEETSVGSKILNAKSGRHDDELQGRTAFTSGTVGRRRIRRRRRKRVNRKVSSCKRQSSLGEEK